MARVDYTKLEEALLHLVRQGNREAFPFWTRLVMASDDTEREEVVRDLRRYIEARITQFREFFGE